MANLEKKDFEIVNDYVKEAIRTLFEYASIFNNARDNKVRDFFDIEGTTLNESEDRIVTVYFMYDKDQQVIVAHSDDLDGLNFIDAANLKIEDNTIEAIIDRFTNTILSFIKYADFLIKHDEEENK